MIDRSKKKGEEEEDTRSPIIIERYRNRVSILKQAHEYSHQDDVLRAVKGYCQYLKVLADYMGVKEEKLSPKLFDKEKEAAEIMIVSQVYWGLSKAYDRNPKLHRESERCLEQFVRFTLGFKFQYINSQMVRKYLKKKMTYNTKAFQRAFEKIKVDSKACYVATYCYHQQHPYVEELRSFRDQICKNRLGSLFVDSYYRISPSMVNFFKNNSTIGAIFKHAFFRPLIKLLVLFLQRNIDKR